MPTKHDAIVHYLGNLTLDAGQRQLIDAKLALLKARLPAVGHQLQNQCRLHAPSETTLCEPLQGRRFQAGDGQL
jgi:hypothetical protein